MNVVQVIGSFRSLLPIPSWPLLNIEKMQLKAKSKRLSSLIRGVGGMICASPPSTVPR